MMDILAFHEKYLLRPALRFIVYFSIIAISLMTMVKPAQALTILPPGAPPYVEPPPAAAPPPAASPPKPSRPFVWRSTI